jgi:predicted HTH domain antitoxin
MVWYSWIKEPRTNAFYMPVTVDLPEPVLRALGAGTEISRRLLELVVADLYRESKISRGQVRQVLGFTWHETEEFLASKGCVRHYSARDLEEDWENNQRLLGGE